jgi:hypothetical protein
MADPVKPEDDGDAWQSAPQVRPALALKPLQARPAPLKVDKTDVFGQRPTPSQLGLDPRVEPGFHDPVPPKRIEKTEPFGSLPTRAQLGLETAAPLPVQRSDPFVPRPTSAQLGIESATKPARAENTDPFAARPVRAEGVPKDAFAPRATMTVTRLSAVPPPAPTSIESRLPPPATKVPLPRRVGEPLDPPVTPQPRATTSLDPPIPPARRATTSLDPPMEPARRATTSLDPPMPPARRTTDAPSVPPVSSAPAEAAPDAAPAPPAVVIKRHLARNGSLTAAAALMVVAVGASLFGGGGLDTGLYTPEEWATLSALWRDTTVEKGPRPADPEVIAAVTSVYGTVARALMAPGETPRPLLVLDEDRERAFALPDGTVVVSVGVLKRLHSEAELAALLAHVLAHQTVGDVGRGLPKFSNGLGLALSATPPKEALGAAAIGDAMVNYPVSEARADALAIRALKVAAWDAQGMRKALDAMKGSPWLGLHASWPERPAALDDEEHRRLPGSNLLQNDSGKSNVEDYETRVLEPLGIVTASSMARAAPIPEPPPRPAPDVTTRP